MTEKIPPVEETSEINKEGIGDQSVVSVEFPKAEKYEIDPKTQKDIEDLEAELKFRESPLNQEIKDAGAKKDTGGEKEKYEAPVISMPPRPTSKWRNVAMGVAAFLGIGAATTTKAESVNLSDSTKNKTEKVSTTKKDSLEKKYDGTEKVNDEIRNAWGDYLDYLKSIDMQGKPELDKGGLGYKIFDEYVATHKTILTRETLKLVVDEAEKVRAKMIKDVRESRAQWAEGVTEENFLASVVRNSKTGIPEYPGSNLTNFSFGKSKTITVEKTGTDYNKIASSAVNSKLKDKISDLTTDDYKITKVTDDGFVKSNNIGKDRNPMANSDFVKSNPKKYNKK